MKQRLRGRDPMIGEQCDYFDTLYDGDASIHIVLLMYFGVRSAHDKSSFENGGCDLVKESHMM